MSFLKLVSTSNLKLLPIFTAHISIFSLLTPFFIFSKTASLPLLLHHHHSRRNFHHDVEMSGKFKRKGDDNHASDADSDGNAPPKKSVKSNDDEDGIVVCEISKNRRVSVRSWQGKVMVDIREFYVKDGKQMPGRKGISLTMDQWKVLREHAEEIDQAVTENS